MKKAATKKTTTAKAPDATAPVETTDRPTTVSGRAICHFKSSQGFHSCGSMVTLHGPDADRYKHFLN